MSQQGSMGWLASLAAFALAALGMTAPREAAAQGPYAPETFNVDKCIPPVTNLKYYKSPPGQDQLHKAHQKWAQVQARKSSHWRFNNCQQPSHSFASTASVHTFSSELDCEISIDDGLSFVPVSATALCTVVVTFNHIDGDTEYYDNEMVQMDVTGLPAGMTVRESPTLASTGATTIRPVPGGYMISSYFDIFTDLSPNGGVTWIPSRDDTGAPLPGHVAMVDGDPVPTDKQTWSTIKVLYK